MSSLTSGKGVLMKDYTLGLDIGSNSVGWAMLNGKPEPGATNLLTGARVFPEGTERTKSGEQSRNLDRRLARQVRRQLDRRSRRRRKLEHVLVAAGVYPTNEAKKMLLMKEDPYALRRRALDEELRPEQFARALKHLGQRRGFKSSLKTEAEEAKEEGEIKKEINALAQEIQEAGARTLGEYLAQKMEHEQTARRIHTSRAMYLDEFEKMWNSQAASRPDIWTDDLKSQVHHAIFYQRPLKPQDHLIGKCELEPEEKRCPRASWFAQQYRVLTDVNNLRILSRGGERKLTDEERKRLLNILMTQVSPVTVKKIKEKVLGLDEFESLNFEQSARDKMEGNHIEARLRKIFKKDFSEKADWLRETVWEGLLKEDSDEFKETAKQQWGLTEDEIKALYKIKRPAGYFNYSLKAIRKLLPHLEAGLDLYEAKKAAGYKETGVETQGFLPPVHASEFRNPVVIRALSETRKVVNAIVREYGLPTRIVVEMARETKGTIKSRKEQTFKNRKMQQYHDEIRQKLAELGVPANRDTIIKYKLWEECNRVCPFSGQAISATELFGDTYRFDIEHIFPFPVSLDDSYMNKTLCERSENHKKRNRTPYEAYHGTPQYDQILARVGQNRKMPYAKRKKFWMREVPDEFTHRQLNDTSYIAKAVTLYLKRLGTQVHTTRGQITAELRRQWGLNSILGRGGDGERKIRDDHRHHAVDAVVVALSTRSHINALRHKYDFKLGKRFPSPWENVGLGKDTFRDAVKKSIEAINISHRPERKVSGKFNEETNYGATNQKDVFTYRVPLEALTPSKAGRIIDDTVREIVYERLRKHGYTPGTGSSTVKAATFKDELRMKTRSGEPGPAIKAVRICDTFKNLIPIKDSSGNTYRHVKPGSNHHMAIFEYKDENGKLRRCKEIVTRFEAYRRVDRGEPVVRHSHSERPEAAFLMSLAINDMVLMPNENGGNTLYRVQKISGAEGEQGVKLHLREHTAATINYPETLKMVTSLAPDKFNAIKVNVDPLGQIQRAND